MKTGSSQLRDLKKQYATFNEYFDSFKNKYVMINAQANKMRY
jgi:hypothetical protein